MTIGNNKMDVPQKRVISFVLPVYNEYGNLQQLHKKITAVMKNQPDDYELIFIDDGSTDGSFDILRAILQSDKKVRIIKLRKNFGKSAAYSAGFHNARGEVIITMDTDLQDDPNDISLFMNEINAGHDLVVGWRHARKDSVGKTLPSKVFNKVVSWVTKVPLHDFNCPFKAYRKEVLEEIEIYGELHRYIPVLASAKGFSIKEIKITNSPRQSGNSKYGTERYLRGMLDLLTVIFITRFSKRPLHLFGLGGIISFALGLATILFLVAAHFLYVLGMLADRGWHFHDRPALNLGILLMIVGGQFLSIGLLGELLIMKSNFGSNKDQYSIRRILED